MDSRNLFIEIGKLFVLLDSNSFDLLIKEDNRVALAILNYNDSELIEFVRNPLMTSSEELQRVTEYGIELDSNSWIRGISISHTNSAQRFHFCYRNESVLSIAQEIFDREGITNQEFERILLIFVQATLSNLRRHNANIFVTDDAVLLKKRRWFESHFPGGVLNVMSVEEAGFFFDLFFKKKGKYLLSSRFTLNKGYWYWLSMRLKLPHYNVGDPMIDALSLRFQYILMALDEIGIQFYSGTDNDTMDNTLYHFNYLISLITGIFDNLALKTNSHLAINFVDLRKVCINNNSGREFLREIRNKNQGLRDHISVYMDFINLIYEFRELVVHREGLSSTAFENMDEHWKANFIKINNDIRTKLRTCGDSPSAYDPFTLWGFYQIHNEVLLDPYHFSLEAIKKLAAFVDRYLELFGYASFIDSARCGSGEFANTLNRFEQEHLGF